MEERLEREIHGLYMEKKEDDHPFLFSFPSILFYNLMTYEK